MIRSMRHILPWFLMLLLALRGLTGVAMATESAQTVQIKYI